MRKQTKSAIVCNICGQVTNPAEYGIYCDFCGELANDPNNRVFEVSLFYKSGDRPTDSLEFCSALCARKWLLDRSVNWNWNVVQFITMPYIWAENDLRTFLKEEEVK